MNDTTLYQNNELIDVKNEVSWKTILFGDENGSHKIRKARSLVDVELPNDYGYLTVYIRETCRDDSRSLYKEIRFPYARYDRRQFRLSSSWIRFSRLMPIYVGRITRQTIIYSSKGAHILPSLFTFHRKLVSLAELLAYGYASLTKYGGRMSANFNIGEYTHSGAFFDAAVPRFDPRRGIFVGAMRSNYRSLFQRQCDEIYEKVLDKHRLAYEEFLDASPEKDNDFYNRPRPRPRILYRNYNL